MDMTILTELEYLEKTSSGNLEMPIRFTNSGFSTPFSQYNAHTNGITGGGDGTIMLGNYMAMLATEYKLLKNGGNSTDAEKTLDELFLSIQAYRRLDKEFNYFMLKEGERQVLDTIKQKIYTIDSLGNVVDSSIISHSSLACDSLKMNSGIDTSGFSGMFYRTDIYQGDQIGTQSYAGQGYGNTFTELKNHYDKNGKFIPHGDFLFGGQMGYFTSMDQITGLIYGLSMVKTMIGTPRTDKESEIVEKANNALIGLICSGLNRIQLEGCFKGLGMLKGDGFYSGFKEKLLDVAVKNDLLANVLTSCSFSSKTLFNFMAGNHSGIDYLKRICNNSGIKPFESNLWARLYSISPLDDNPLASDIKAYSRSSEKLKKYSFGLSAAIFNQNDVSKDKLDYVLQNHCGKMKEKLASAPCCGPCVNCASAPSHLFLPDGVLANQNLNIDWFTEDSNADTFPCGATKESHTAPTYYNGIDYMLSMNLMLLACEQDINGNFKLGSEDFRPKTTPISPLPNIEGCEDVGTLHIVGPTEVCAGSTVKFELSCNEWFAPPRDDNDDKDGFTDNKNASWNINNGIVKDAKGLDLKSEWHSITYSVPSTATGTFNVSFNWGDIANGVKDRGVQKTITVINKAPNLSIIASRTDEKHCYFSVTTNTGKIYGFEMQSFPQQIDITERNACGSSTIRVDVPEGNCKELPRTIKTSNDGMMDFQVLYNPATHIVKVKSDVLYTIPFQTKLYDLNGRLVNQSSFENSDIILDLNSLELQSGIYIFQVSNNEQFIKSSRVYYDHE
jgi:hypothetical protein